MKKILLKDIKNIELNILSEFHNFCQKNNLKYSISYGTLLGAIRHKGFIPWDDDVDVIMPRPDYEKFLKIYSNNGKYRLLSHELNSDYYYDFAKLVDFDTIIEETGQYLIENMGVYIDVFPIDGINSYNNKWHFMKNTLYCNILYLSYQKGIDGTFFKRVIKLLLWLPAKILGFKKWVKIKDSLLKKYKYEECKYAYGSPYQQKEVMPKEMYESYVDVEFEGKKFKAIRDYDTYLKQIYGDYMKLPPKEKRVTHHKMIAYYKKNNS